MIVPCIVKSWLYCSSDTNCRPGTASSARIARAIAPATKNQKVERMRYMYPITLWSVEVIQETTIAPGLFLRTTGVAGPAVAVTLSPRIVIASSHLVLGLRLSCVRYRVCRPAPSP